MTTDQITALVAVIKSARRSLELQMILVNLIDPLSNADRVAVRDAALAAGVKALPRSLYYNYAQQTWID